MLRNDASIQQIKAAQYIAGGPPPKRRRVYETVNARIRRLHANYANKNTIDFLRGISYNLSRLDYIINDILQSTFADNGKVDIHKDIYSTQESIYTFE